MLLFLASVSHTAPLISSNCQSHSYFTTMQEIFQYCLQQMKKWIPSGSSFLSGLFLSFFFFLSTSSCVCRPGGCAVQGSRFSSSTTLPDEVLNFVKTHPLMDETVPLLGHRPWVVKTMGRYTEWLSCLIAPTQSFICQDKGKHKSEK